MCRRFPGDSISYGCRGYVKSNNGDIKGAIADCNKALAIKENRWYYNTRRRCWAAKARMEQGDMRECFLFRALQDYWHSQHVSQPECQEKDDDGESRKRSENILELKESQLAAVL